MNNNKPRRNNYNSKAAYEAALRTWQLRHMRELMPRSAQNALARALESHRSNRRLPGQPTPLQVALNLEKYAKMYKKGQKDLERTDALTNLYFGSPDHTRERLLYPRVRQQYNRALYRRDLARNMYTRMKKKVPPSMRSLFDNIKSENLDTRQHFMNAARHNAAARHIEHRMVSPHFALGRKLQKLKFLRNAGELNVGQKRKRNNTPRNKNNSETNENYRQYLIQWYRNKGINTNNNMALSQLKKRFQRNNKK